MEEFVRPFARPRYRIGYEPDAGFEAVPLPYQLHGAGESVHVHFEGLKVIPIEQGLRPIAFQLLPDVSSCFLLSIAHIAPSLHFW